MSLNLTACWLESKLAASMIHFSATVGISNLYLNGPGGASGDGFPIPSGGLLKSLMIWDGTTLHTIEQDIPFNDGDRIAIAGVYDPTPQTFTLAVVKNGASIPLSLENIPPNTTYFATVELLLKEDA
jgi:hypothetical protein